jgi:hypothetical protein
MTKKQESIRDITGLFFRTPTSKKADWQGRVISSPLAGYYLVELFDWVLGEHHAYRLVTIQDMTSWTFYATAEQMREASDKSKPPT